MAWTQEQLDALEEAIAKGVLTVEYNDKRIKYRSLQEMFQIRNEMKKALGLQNLGDRLYVQTSKGTC